MDYKEEIRKILKEDTTIPPEQREKLEEILLADEKCEDESIRQNCIYFLRLQKSHHAETLIIDECIAWLEKQGYKFVNIDIESMVSSYEQRLKSQGGIGNSPLVNMCLTAFRRGVENTLDELNLKKLEKKGEQGTLCDKCKKAQPSHSCQDITELGRCAVEHEQKHADEDCEAKRKAEQNLAWSESDDFRTRTLIDVVKCVCSIRTESRNEFIGWLKTIKYRIAPQQKEWSKEDERNLQNIDSVLFRENSLSEEECMKLRNWLQSIKERAVWKPSEEQIVALRWVLNNIPYNKHKEEISGLFDQIKDL